MPVLAICRGHQVLNVALGGTLDQHITDRDGVLRARSARRRRRRASSTRSRSRPGTRLASAHGHDARDRVVVTTTRRSRRPATGLRVVARAADGVIEGTELADPDGPWIVSVQWHPEDTAATDPAQQGLFDELVRRAGA